MSSFVHSLCSYYHVQRNHLMDRVTST